MTDHDHQDHHAEEHDLGLSHDLPRMLSHDRLGRRGVLSVLGALGATAALAACAPERTTISTDAAATRPTGAPPPAGAPGAAAVAVADGEIPEETAGPYPGDGSNGPNVLSDSGVVRRDLTHSFGSASGVATGVPVTVRLTVLDLQGEAATPLTGAAVYLWHCDRQGRYSLYDDGVTDENYLRGVQVADAAGRLEFTTVFPGCYAGRWPHLHFEVYPSLAEATSYTGKLRTSQLALPADACAAVYASEGYESSVDNFAGVDLDTDNVFADGHSLQLAKAEGSVGEGYVVTLNVPV